MSSCTYRQFILLISAWLCASISLGQNLVPNPSFEDQIDCPGGLEYAPPWQDAVDFATADLFHTCSGVPVNFWGMQLPHTGEAYVGMYGYKVNAWREYIQAPLLETLSANQMYHFSMFVSLADMHCGIIPLGVHISESRPPSYDWDPVLLNAKAQFENENAYLTDTENWTLLEGCLLANGGEQWITLGVFKTHSEVILDPACPFAPSIDLGGYYYIDDVTLEAVDPDEVFIADIGGPFAGCGEVLIDPDIPGQFYWPDGSVGPTWTVTENGIYEFSVVDGCSLGTGTFEVVMLSEEVDLGPDEIQLCDGDVYTISLYGGIGEYIWSTGSTSSYIEITESGEYRVTVDNGCIVTIGEINVEFVDPIPEPLFGDDTYLCSGDEITFDFDEIIGEFTWQDGAATNHYTITGPGNYALTISNACGEVTDAINIIEINEPIVNLGPDTSICENSVLEIQLDPTQGDYFWQDGSYDPHYTISGAGLYSVIVTNECGSQSDEINVSVVPALQLNLDEHINLCPAQLPFTVDATTTGAMHYLWNDGATSASHMITTAGTYGVTATNSCFSASDSIIVSISKTSPVVELSADTVLCPGQSIVLTNTGADGVYLWHDQSMADTLLVTQAGEYSLAVTNVCGTGTDTIHIDYIAPLEVNLGPDFSICSSETFVLSPGNANVSYQWQDTSTADSFVVMTPGIYHVTISDQCTQAADTVVVSVNNNPPDVDLPASLNLCQGESITLEAGIGGVSYVWHDGSQESSLLINAPGTYSITVSSNCGVDEDSVVVIDLGPQPFVELGSDVDLCDGETLTLTPVFSNVNNWMWSDGSSAPTIDIASGGEISIVATNACGDVHETMTVTLLPAIPPLSLGNDTAICPGEIVTLSINIPDVDITWSEGTQGNSIAVANAGSYHAVITNSCGEAADTIDVTVLPAAPTVDLGGDELWCAGDVFVFDPGVTNADYLWQDGSSATSYTATTPATIILQVSNSCGVDVDTVLIELNPNGPDVDLGPNLVGCIGDEVTIDAGISGVSYEWQDGSTGESFTTSTSQTLILTIANNCGTDADTVEVDLSGVGPTVDLGVDTTICDGAQVLLQASVESGTSLMWQDGSTSSDYTITNEGTYSLLATNACGVARDTIEVAVQFPPQPFSLGPDTTLCLGESIVLSVPNTGDAILWYDGSTESTIIANEGHVYTVQLSNQCGSQTDAMELTVLDDVPTVTLDDHINRCPEEILTLDVTQPFPVTYAWSTGDNVPAITILTPGVYAITIFNECFTVHDEVVVTEDDCDTHVYVPNVFSPNGDNINDVFSVGFSDNVEVLTMQGVIYDRWGDLVYSSDEIPFEWNGYFADKVMNPGVFVYRINVKYRVRGMLRAEHLVGDVTIVK